MIFRWIFKGRNLGRRRRTMIPLGQRSERGTSTIGILGQSPKPFKFGARGDRMSSRKWRKPLIPRVTFSRAADNPSRRPQCHNTPDRGGIEKTHQCELPLLQIAQLPHNQSKREHVGPRRIAISSVQFWRLLSRDEHSGLNDTQLLKPAHPEVCDFGTVF
jgi:hypothetical protein